MAERLKFDKTLADKILHYWFEKLGPDTWFSSNDDVDDEIKSEFFDHWDILREQPTKAFTSSASNALAAVILFDQFPRNMFRGQAPSFSSDALALMISKASIEQGYDDKLADKECAFLYMPFMHSENIDDQNKSVTLFQAKGLKFESGFAIEHRDAIAKFGRFPHRNAILGRDSTRAEKQAIADGLSW